MNWKKEWKKFVLIIGIFIVCYYLPVGSNRFDKAILEAFYLVKWYAKEHVILCLIPAFFIAGAISVFISQASVIKYLGDRANKILAYGVASVSGTILAVCSCTVLPLFTGIYRMGAGLGPAITFLYAGPAINVLAIILTTRVLGIQLGIARAIGAIVFSVIIGIIMHIIFHKEGKNKTKKIVIPESEIKRSLLWNVLYFTSMVSILIFVNWAKPDQTTGIWFFIYNFKWIITSIFASILGIILILWFKIKWWKILFTAISVFILTLLFSGKPVIPFLAGIIGLSLFIATNKGETQSWFSSSWQFAKQILPLLLFGVFIAGVLLGRINHEGLIPSHWINRAVGGNSLRSNFFASFAGAFMYFATLTEVPILQGLINNGMGKGPSLALLLAGPALSLPNMLVIRSVLGNKKTIVFVALVIVMATISGFIFGVFFK